MLMTYEIQVSTKSGGCLAYGKKVFQRLWRV